MSEVLNDPLTHVVRCGPVMRSAVNERLTPLALLLPAEFMGVPVEYDLTYESPRSTIRGYKYTDLLTSCVWVSPCNTGLAVRLGREAVARGATAIGRAVAEAVTASLQDKYRLRPAGRAPEALVVMPGSNVLERDVVDWTIVDAAVAAGAWIKPHPITTRLDVRELERRYPCRVIHPDAALYGMLAACTRLYYPANSETGLAGMLLGKATACITKRGKFGTYTALYEALDGHKDAREALAALFSHPETGLFSIHHMPLVDMRQWVNRFFMAYQDFPHGRERLATARALLA